MDVPTHPIEKTMLKKLKLLWRHVSRRYRYSLLAFSLLCLNYKLSDVLLNAGDIYLVYLLVILSGISATLMVLAIRQDKAVTKERITQKKEYRYQKNQIRRAERECQRRKAELGDNDVCNAPDKPED
jgi:hypothetical protein